MTNLNNSTDFEQEQPRNQLAKNIINRVVFSEQKLDNNSVELLAPVLNIDNILTSHCDHSYAVRESLNLGTINVKGVCLSFKENNCDF